MPIKRPILPEGNQAIKKQLLLSFSTNGKDSTQRLLACIWHTAALNTDLDSCPPEVKPRPMKTIYIVHPTQQSGCGLLHCTAKKPIKLWSLGSTYNLTLPPSHLPLSHVQSHNTPLQCLHPLPYKHYNIASPNLHPNIDHTDLLRSHSQQSVSISL